jgi:hypothetical protein
VEPQPFVKDFDAIKDARFGFGSGGEVVLAQAVFEASPKTFHGGIVVVLILRLMLGVISADARRCR